MSGSNPHESPSSASASTTPSERRHQTWFWVGVCLLAVSLGFWALALLELGTAGGDWGTVLLGGVVITVVPMSLGAYLVWRERTPSSVPISTTSSEELKKTPVLLVILLFVLTLGFYGVYWFTSRRKVLNRLAGRNEINLGLCIAAFFSALALNIAPAMLGDFHFVIRLAASIVLLVLTFRVKDILDANYDSDFSGLLTIFFHIFYLQYKINRSERLDEEHQELPASVLGLR